MKTLLAIFAGTTLTAGITSAAPVSYFTSFSEGDSPTFVEGALNDQNTWVAHPSFFVSDATGTGLVNQVNANGPVHLASSSDVTGELAAGETITLTLKLNFVGDFLNQNSGAWLLGLSNSPTGMGERSIDTIGGATFQNNSNSNFWLAPIEFPNESKFDTDIAWDSNFHTLTTTVTRSATTNEFDITADIDGRSTSYIMTHAGLWSGDDDAYAGFRFRGNQAGNIDSFGVSSSGDGGGGSDTITIDATSYEAGTGVTINYTSTAGPVDVYRNATGDLNSGNFSLIASGETGGTYTDPTADAAMAPNVFYLLVTAGDSPFGL